MLRADGRQTLMQGKQMLRNKVFKESAAGGRHDGESSAGSCHLLSAKLWLAHSVTILSFQTEQPNL